MDLGVIRSLKAKYSKKYNSKYLKKFREKRRSVDYFDLKWNANACFCLEFSIP